MCVVQWWTLALNPRHRPSIHPYMQAHGGHATLTSPSAAGGKSKTKASKSKAKGSVASSSGGAEAAAAALVQLPPVPRGDLVIPDGFPVVVDTTLKDMRRAAVNLDMRASVHQGDGILSINLSLTPSHPPPSL